jgi:hypothetical protein
VRKGDLVRVGTVDSGELGYTDYLTVTEKVLVTKITNMIPKTKDSGGTVVTIAYPQSVNSHPIPMVQFDSAGKVTNAVTLPTPMYVYKLNYAINVSLPTPVTYNATNLLTVAPDATTTSRMLNAMLMMERHLCFTNMTATDVRERRLYPLYRVARPAKELVVHLDRGVKAVHSIKLMGASIVNKRQAGFATAHEYQTDDWAALHIKEVQGEVISDNRSANGCFACLHAGHLSNMTAGAADLYEQHPDGLVTHTFEQPRTDLRTLTCSFTDTDGEPAHLGRVHLWFKLCVTHG